ncbi:hypothetical protein HUW63_27715 [Myxococcus sp. AM001]|uniref:hypothetical protein n=1 Tax=Myxococcus TaxID=32 RepID=UPI0013D822E7|nr:MULTISPECIES: hypothetical protein [Myxococcus]NVJ01111.1 hypothetical protein [Myxococcus sp. AM009]NVJ09010.1 hypothetical protein [Myxococcus sp. AM001]NVJ16431.1 hypothetical protein [Myxococcus sp. AM010]WIG93611.1 hypothetical protein KGD87_23875 [Myxococcus sp. SDU36]
MMKKLIAAVALCVGSAAFAQQQPSRTQVPRPGTEKSTGVDATEVGPAIGEAAKDVTGVQTEDEGTFKMDKAMSLRGTLKDATADGVSLSRPGLPDADLDVRDKTKLMLDGKKVAKTDEIPEGASVRAKFQLEGQEVVALELRATSPKGAKKKQPGTGGAGTQPHESVDKELDGTPTR